MKIAAAFFILSSLAPAACIVVPSSRISARDLATAVPLFQALDGNDDIGYAPFPGTVRVLTSRDIFFAARHYGLAFPTGEPAPSVCIERMVHPLSVQELRTAMLSSLNLAGAKLEILEFINRPVPPGRLEFPLATLNHPPGNNPETAVTWQGRLIYDDNRSLSIWARVRISVEQEVVVARETIPKGEVIRIEQIATLRIPGFPVFAPTHVPLVVVGRIARRTLAVGKPIVDSALEDAQDVMRGDTVHVQVTDGAATLRLDGIAQSSGGKGEVIVVHNPASGRNFRAIVEGREQVIIRGNL